MAKIWNVGNRIMNTYVYYTPSGYIMVDTGYEHSLASVKKKLKRVGISLAEIRYVFSLLNVAVVHFLHGHFVSL